jgi:RNA-directed DNA polymerase
LKLKDIKTLNDLANYFGYEEYEKFKGLIYPIPLYSSFKLPKKTGGYREIHAPGARLKEHQQKLAEDLKRIFGNRSLVAHSFIPRRSIVTNALPHVGRASVVRVDLTDFFGHITFARVQGVFKASPFNFPYDVSSVLAQFCCYQKKLPQGAPTSAALTNFVCLTLDGMLSRLARRFKARYTRYSDDLTFSFKYLPLKKISRDFFIVAKDDDDRILVTPGPMLQKTIEDAGFQINPIKTRGANQNRRQLITGLIVNKKLTTTRKYTDQIRRALHIWEKFGIKIAEERCTPILNNRAYASEMTPDFIPVIRGKLNFLSMVTGRAGATYQQFALKYNQLLRRDVPLRMGALLKLDPRVQNAQDALKATWYLENGNYFQGTAFRFTGNIWITCAHCIGSISEREIYPDITLSSGDWKVKDLRVRVASVDWDRDLAILRPQPLEAVPRYLPYFTPEWTLPTTDSNLAIYGFPAGRPNQPPIFMRTRVLRCRTKMTISRIEIDKTIYKGNSGGPLFNDGYQVVGVVTEGAIFMMDRDGLDYSQGENACIAILELRNLGVAI